MSKIYLWGTIVLLLGLGFWRYSVVVQELGEAEQANRQYQVTIKSMQQEKDSDREKQRQDSEIGLKHYNESLAIVRSEMKKKEDLLLHRINILKKEADRTKKENHQLKSGFKSMEVKSNEKESFNENNAEACAELPIPEYYLKQL